MLTLELLRVIWWLLLGILFIGFAIFDGFDFGVATLLPFVAKNDIEKRVVINSIGPFWEGNQVWIILGAGAVFAAWPYVYAASFSGAYFAVLLLLLTMGICRPVSFKYRSKVENLAWRRFWDTVIFVGGVAPALIFGILVGNILMGLPFSLDSTMRTTYTGSLLDLFSPFALWCGITSLCMLIMHGGLYLAIKTENPIRDRAIAWSRLFAVCLIIAFAIGGIWVATYLNGYQVTSPIDPFADSNPLHKTVILKTGAWLNNYTIYPGTITAPILGFLGAIFAFILARAATRLAFIASSIAIFGVIATVGVSMFPFILPSSLDYTSSLLVWDASSSYLTLLVMFFSVVIFMPLILLYTTWVYYMLRGKVSRAYIEENTNHSAY